MVRHLPNLQRPCPQDSRSLILGHVRRCTPLILRNLLFLGRNRRIFLPTATRAGVLPDFHDSVRSFGVGIRTVFVGVVDGVARVFGIIGVESSFNGFLVIEMWFFGFVGFIAGEREC